MRRAHFTAMTLLALTISAQAHDVRRGDGTLVAHDCDAAFFTEAQVRNVSVTLPEIYDCRGATWPDIPAACVAEQPTLTASAD